jgi:hypothetical protein
MRTAESGIAELHKVVDTLLIIPNQNLFRVANEKTTFADAFAMADQVLYSGVACITDLMVKEGLINLDFADVRAVMREMGKAMMGTGEASGDKRALTAAEAAIANPLIDDSSMKGARGLLISITGGKDLTLFEVDEAATRIREEVDQDANIIVGATFDESLDGIIRVSVVATGIEQALIRNATPGAALAPSAATPTASPENRLAELTARLRADNARLAERAAQKMEAPAQAAPVAAAPQRASNTVERAALAAIAAAVAPEAPKQPAPLQSASYGDVMVRPTTARSRGSKSMNPPRPRRSSRRRPNVRRRARRGCRNSRNCRCRPRTRSGRPAATARRSIRRRPGCPCCSASPMSASAAATRKPSRRSRPAPPVRPWRLCRRCRSASRSARLPSRSPQTIRYRNTLAGQRHKASTFTAALHLLPRRHRATIIWISRPSCAASPTDICYNPHDQEVSAPASRDLHFLPGPARRPLWQATDFK